MLAKIGDNDECWNNAILSNEAIFHVNRHNCRIRGLKPSHEFTEYERDSQKVNIWCSFMHDWVIGPFIFVEQTINGIVYCDICVGRMFFPNYTNTAMLSFTFLQQFLNLRCEIILKLIQLVCVRFFKQVVVCSISLINTGIIKIHVHT